MSIVIRETDSSTRASERLDPVYRRHSIFSVFPSRVDPERDMIVSLSRQTWEEEPYDLVEWSNTPLPAMTVPQYSELFAAEVGKFWTGLTGEITAIAGSVELYPSREIAPVNTFYLLTAARTFRESSRREAQWKTSVEEQLLALLRLDQNWDSFNARPIETGAVWKALTLAKELAEPGVPQPSVVPAPSGGVQLEWHLRGLSLEVEIDPGGAIGLFFVDRDSGNEIQVDHLEIEESLQHCLALLQRGVND